MHPGSNCFANNLQEISILCMLGNYTMFLSFADCFKIIVFKILFEGDNKFKFRLGLAFCQT